MNAARFALAAALCVTALAACGGDASDEPQTSASGVPGVGGILTWAVADRVATVDPLRASTRAERIVARQIHEPLTAVISAPFGDAGGVAGLAVNARPSLGSTVWTLNLRNGIRFRDGEPLNAAAVRANARRWQADSAARRLLPPFAIDAPRPDQVRFILTAPEPDLPELLAAPELGIVSPRALQRSVFTAAPAQRGTGTGPFELREPEQGRVLLARNVDWWGAARGLGPALDQIEFRIERSGPIRLALLEAGKARVADQLGREQADLAELDPLLTVLPGSGGRSLALERSVRGIEDAREIPALAEVWLTTLAAER